MKDSFTNVGACFERKITVKISGQEQIFLLIGIYRAATFAVQPKLDRFYDKK